MAGLRTIDRVLLFTLGPLWVARASGLLVLRKPVEPVRLRAALMHLLDAAR